MISLILPKLILSAAIARDGMFTFSFSSSSSSLVLVFFDYENDEEDDDDSNFNSTTQGKSAGISSELAKLQITRGDFDVFFSANLEILFGRVSALR